MDVLYPAAPAAVPPSLTQASKAYRRQAWVALLALLAFAVFYLALTGWFGWKAYQLMRAALQGSRDGFWLFLGGAAAAFMAVFMAKALFFVKRGAPEGLTEVTAQDQPELFAFLYRLADEAKAPRPKRVYLSGRVNAAVFYDLSPLNLLLPSRKNLEIGLALVNVLNLSEFKAVLAHEFGHFAQRSMAVGRWVYVAQQIAGHIVAHRDALDRFLRGLSSFDIRIGWVGWLLSVVVWSIRSVVDSFFRVVLVAERALSREMEFQADSIAVSLSGSDALIEALYRCQAADQAWDRTLEFANSEAAKGWLTADLFEIQTGVIERLRMILDEPAFGRPPRAAGDPATHRIFKKEMVQASRMWATHPFHHEREDHAKRHYLDVPREQASAWSVFRDAPALRLQVSATLFRQGETPLPVAAREASLAALEAEYGRESYKRIYRGCYLTRTVTRNAEQAEDLYGASPANRAAVYPASLADDLQAAQALQVEQAQLEAMKAGQAKASDGTLRFRGKPIRARQLPVAIRQVDGELKAVQARLAEHDRLCRTVGRDLARTQGPGWEAYLLGLLRLVHYAEHTQANVADAQGALANVVAMVTAKRKVSEKEIERILVHARDLHGVLDEVHEGRASVRPDAVILATMGVADWGAALGDWKFTAPSRENISQWLDAVDSWIRPVLDALGKLRRAAMDQLLTTEGRLSRAAYEGQTLDEPPAVPEVPAAYRRFVVGSERPRQQKLDWWSRFQVADGWLAGSVRLLVAGGIIGSLLGMSGSLGNARLLVHNGLDRPVTVHLGERALPLAAGAHASAELEVDVPVKVTARTAQGQVIESFSETPDLAGGQYVYNVASASPMLEWTAVYGNVSPVPERPLGTPRWFLSAVEHLLEEPPQQIQTKGGGGTRTVLSAPEKPSARVALGLVADEKARARLIQVHARWDGENSAYLNDWLNAASEQPGFAELLRARLADQPLDIATLRMEQEQTDPLARDAACARQRALAGAQPGQADLQYLAVRCMTRGPARDAAFREGHARYPRNSWFALAAGSDYAAAGEWAAASRAYDTAMRLPMLTDQAALGLARVRRVAQGPQVDVQDLLPKSEWLRQEHAIERGTDIAADSASRVYVELARGQLLEVRRLLGSVSRRDAHALRLAAASDGAPAELVQKSLALPAQEGLNGYTVWSAIGLALRHGRPIEELAAPIGLMDAERARPMRRFIEVLQHSRDADEAEAALAGASLELRAQAYVMGAIVLEAKAPAHWRSVAKRVLFATERPYLS